MTKGMSVRVVNNKGGLVRVVIGRVVRIFDNVGEDVDVALGLVMVGVVGVVVDGLEGRDVGAVVTVGRNVSAVHGTNNEQTRKRTNDATTATTMFVVKSRLSAMRLEGRGVVVRYRLS